MFLVFNVERDLLRFCQTLFTNKRTFMKLQYCVNCGCPSFYLKISTLPLVWNSTAVSRSHICYPRASAYDLAAYFVRSHHSCYLIFPTHCVNFLSFYLFLFHFLSFILIIRSDFYIIFQLQWIQSETKSE